MRHGRDWMKMKRLTSSVSVTSLRLVSSGAVTESYFFLIFSHRPLKIAIVSSSLPSSPRSNVVSAMFICKFSRKKLISFGCHPPLDGVTRGVQPPLPALPPSDATALCSFIIHGEFKLTIWAADSTLSSLPKTLPTSLLPSIHRVRSWITD